MERRAGYSASALSAAASGDRLPSLAVTQAYVGACGGDQDEWALTWDAARVELENACAGDGEIGGDLNSGIDGGINGGVIGGIDGETTCGAGLGDGAVGGSGAGISGDVAGGAVPPGSAGPVHRAPEPPRRRRVTLWLGLVSIGLIGLVTAGAFGKDLPFRSTSATQPGPTGTQEPRTGGQPSPTDTQGTATPQKKPAFTAVAGPDCPRDTGRTVRVSGVPGEDGWQDADASGWKGDGCGDGFLTSKLTYDPQSAEHPQNTFQWRFTTGLRGHRQCFLEMYVPRSPLAGQRVWYTVSDGFEYDARAVAAFTLDQRARQGTWVSAPFPVPVASGMVMVEIKDTGLGNTSGGRPMAAAPIRLSCV
ncbi:hypothetical protein AB0I81_24045 [Nonomuraea sp. NPDC050404]|uniref:hypothetical protein n=1 Tax=Nonomuraea sp. NPDC050404 TaxID=3155783 RepID=UPI00340B4CB0